MVINPRESTSPETGTEALKQSAQEALPDQSPLATIGQEYGHVVQAKQSLSRARRSAAETTHQIAELRSSAGLAESSEPSPAVARAEKMHEDITRQEADLGRAESKYLQVPDQVSPEQPRQEHMHHAFDRVIESADKTEEELHRQREQMAEEFVTESVRKALDHFGPYLQGVRNSEEATRLIELKLKTWITAGAQEFIKTGKNVEDMGWEMNLEMAHYEGSDGQRIEYVTNISLGSWFGSNEKDERDLVSERNQLDLQRADKLGDLEKRQAA